MGCASSKHLKNQANAEGWTSPPSKSKSTSKTFHKDHKDRSFEDYHRHLVALTSSSYGLLKVESPKPAEDVQKKKRPGADSLNEMYDKLRSFDLAADSAAPKPWNEVSNMLENLKPGLEKSNSSPAQGWKVRKAGSDVAEDPETIDVGDIMMGLDEETPRGPSRGFDQTPHGPSTVSVVGQTPSKAVVSRKPKQFDKAMSFHTVEELDARLGRSVAAATGKGSKDLKVPVADVVKSSPIVVSGRQGTGERDGFGKENARPLGSAGNGNLSALGREDAVASKTGMGLRSPFVPPPINVRTNTLHHQVLPVVVKDSNINLKESVESRSLSKDVIINSTPGNPLPPGMKYSTSSGKVQLTLNLDYRNIHSPGTPSKQTVSTPDSKVSGSLSKRALAGTSDFFTETNGPLFDPDLLASYEKALENLSEDDWNAIRANQEQGRNALGSESTDEMKETGTPIPGGPGASFRLSDVQIQFIEAQSLSKISSDKVQTKKHDPLESFEEKCPPGGEKTVVLYTTTLRGIRKTFEDCNNVRGILQSFGLSIDERDVSMHLEFRNELRELMGKVVSAPRMFIKGRYIGGWEEVGKLHEEGKLAELVEGLPIEMNGGMCDGCGGMRFVPCLECSGSCKIVDDDNKVVRCTDCNENGLIQCPICS